MPVYPDDKIKSIMSKLKIAVQKSGRLFDGSLKLLKDCGISIDNGKDQLKARARNFPIEVLYLRNDDIPQYVEDGVVDVAIVGQNLLIEKQKEIEEVEELGFSRCKLSLAVPKEISYTDISWFNARAVAVFMYSTEALPAIALAWPGCS